MINISKSNVACYNMIISSERLSIVNEQKHAHVLGMTMCNIVCSSLAVISIANEQRSTRVSSNDNSSAFYLDSFALAGGPIVQEAKAPTTGSAFILRRQERQLD